MARALRLALAALAVTAPVLAGGVAPGAAAATATCAQIAAAEPQAGHTMPPPANVLFAGGFPRLYDCEWDTRSPEPTTGLTDR